MSANGRGARQPGSVSCYVEAVPEIVLIYLYTILYVTTLLWQHGPGYIGILGTTFLTPLVVAVGSSFFYYAVRLRAEWLSVNRPKWLQRAKGSLASAQAICTRFRFIRVLAWITAFGLVGLLWWDSTGYLTLFWKLMLTPGVIFFGLMTFARLLTPFAQWWYSDNIKSMVADLLIPINNSMDRVTHGSPTLIADGPAQEHSTESQVDYSAVFNIAVDGEESRSWELLSNMTRDNALIQFPDFDVAYLRAAYPTGNSGDHASAQVEVLEQGLTKCIRQSWLLGRLSAYWTWKGNAEKAYAFAVKSILSATAIPPGSPGDLVGSLNLLSEVFKASGHRDVARKMTSLNPGYDESDEMRLKTTVVVKRLASSQHTGIVSAGAAKLEAKQF